MQKFCSFLNKILLMCFEGTWNLHVCVSVRSENMNLEMFVIGLASVQGLNVKYLFLEMLELF